jgi:hypothetical protein
MSCSSIANILMKCTAMERVVWISILLSWIVSSREVVGPIDMKNRSSDKTGGEASVHPCAFNDLESVAFAIAARDGNAFNCRPSAKEDNDDFYFACIVLLPQVGAFFCHKRSALH